MQEKTPKYPYPVPELIEHLEAMQRLGQDDGRIYSDLARLLKICHATMQYAHELWRSQSFFSGEPETPTCAALQYALQRLVPLIIDGTVSGWNELLIYIDHPEKYPWYNPERDWPCLPPLCSVQEEEMREELCDEAPSFHA